MIPLPGTYAGGLLRLSLDDPGLRGRGGARRHTELPPAPWLTESVGGRGWGIRWLSELATPGTDPLAPGNPLVFVTGPLGATSARGFSRWIVMTRSPLTGALARSVCGGHFGAALKFAGIDALALEGQAEEPSVLVLDAGDASAAGRPRPDCARNSVPAGELGASTPRRCRKSCAARYGPAAQVACIGPAGERLVRYATITHGTRTASRCGVGTVMGAKQLKAVVVVPPRRRLQPADPPAFDALVRDHYERMKVHPALCQHAHGRHHPHDREGAPSGHAAGEELPDGVHGRAGQPLYRRLPGHEDGQPRLLGLRHPLRAGAPRALRSVRGGVERGAGVRIAVGAGPGTRSRRPGRHRGRRSSLRPLGHRHHQRGREHRLPVRAGPAGSGRGRGDRGADRSGTDRRAGPDLGRQRARSWSCCA